MNELIRKSVEAMHGYVPGEQPREPDIVKLNTNENPYPPSASVLEVLRNICPEDLSRYPDPVAKDLCDVIAGIHGCSASQVFVGNGSDEVLALCTRAFVEDDGSIGFLDPSYSLYPILAEIRNVVTKPVPITEPFGWPFEPSGTVPGPPGYTCSLFMLTNPNAPTGIRYDKNTVRSFCEKLDAVVLVDEAYGDFADEDCSELALDMDNVLLARSLSKSYSLAGVRVGYAIGPEA